VNGKQIASRLRGRPLQGKEEVQQLARQAGVLPTRDLEALIPLVEKRPKDQGQHHLRCMLLA
jgi:hypothetical protein